MQSASARPSPRLTHTALLAALSAAVVAVFLGFLLAATDGHFVPPVVDFYVIAQYARAMAEGHPFQYNPGEPSSTGSTSLLHTALLAAVHAAGAKGEALVGVAMLLGAACYVATVLLARRIGSLLGTREEALLAGLLVALAGPVVWGFLYGADIALFMFLCAWLLERLLCEWHRPRPWGVGAVGSLLALARPEGLPLGLFIAMALSLRRGRPRDLAGRLAPWVPVAAGSGVLGLNRWLTGFWLGSSLTDKSLLANYGLSESAALLATYGQDVLRGLLLGVYPSQVPVGLAQGWAPFFFPPLALLPMAAAVLRPHPGLAPPLRTWVLSVVALSVLVSPNVFLGIHFNRYLMWAFPTGHILVAVGLGVGSRLLPDEADLRRLAFRVGAAVALASGLLSTVRFASLYGEMSGSVYRRDVAAARWISNHLPAGVAMANLATSIEYLTGHRNLNLHGVTCPWFFGNRKAEREAGVFESLGRLPEAARPALLITSVSAQEAYPSMRELVAGAPLFRTNSLSDDILVLRMRYDLVGKNHRMLAPEALSATAGLTEVDRLNVCDSRDEAEHRYRFESRLGELRLHGTARVGRYRPAPDGSSEVLIDGGRAIFGRESFSVAAAPGRDLVVVFRTAGSVAANLLRASGNSQVQIEFPEAGLRVRVGDEEAADVRFRPGDTWEERWFRIPGHLLRSNTARLLISGRYASFHYWFFQ